MFGSAAINEPHRLTARILTPAVHDACGATIALIGTPGESRMLTVARDEGGAACSGLRWLRYNPRATDDRSELRKPRVRSRHLPRLRRVPPWVRGGRVIDQIEIVASGLPAMSVVVITPDRYDTISTVLRHVHAQSVRKELEIVIVAPTVDAIPLDAPAVQGFRGVRVVPFEAVASSTAAARAAGVRAARAPIVAFVEDHCFPQPGWAAALVAAHREPWAAVGPAVGNANPHSAIGWANLLIEYAPWLEPATAGAVEHLPGHNSSYKRNVLLEYGPALETMLESESILHWDLRAKGFALLLEPAATTLHMNFTTIGASTRLRFHSGRLFAAARARRWPLGRRHLYTAAAPLIPLVRVRRILAQAWRRGDAALPANAFPALAFLLGCDAAGEMAGYLLGAGAEAQRAGEFEFHVDRHATAAVQREGGDP